MLGILPERGLLGGRKPLSVELARQAIDTQIAKPLGLTVEEAAAAIYTVQNAQTGDLLRKTVVEAGHDPRDFVVYAFGGAGPAHCARYAAEVGATDVVVPLGPVASAFSAFGLASSDIVLAAELSDPTFVPFDPARAERNFAALEQRVRAGLDRQGLRFATVELHREIDMRYSMQLAEVTAPVAAGPLDAAAIEATAAAFEQRYAELYGKDAGFREAGIQAITFRVRGIGVLPFSPELPVVPAADAADPAAAQTGTRPVCLDARAASSTPRSTTTAPCARATSSPGPRSSRCRPPPWSCPRVPPARSTTWATSPSGAHRDHADPRLGAVLQPPRRPGQLARSLPTALPVHTVTQEQVDGLDPLTYEVVRHRLWSVTDEMGEALKRMSGSPSSPTPTTSTSRSPTSWARRCRSGCTTRCSSGRSTSPSTGRCGTAR